MPNYEMRCQSCGKTFEVALSFAEKDRKAKCPSCKSRKLEQVYSSHIILKKNRTSCSSCAACTPGKCGGC